MSELVLRQADPAWGSERLGEFFGGKTGPKVSQAGCLATVYAQLCRDLGTDPAATPTTVIIAGRAAKERVWYRAEPVQVLLGKQLGLRVGDVVRPPQADTAGMRMALLGALRQGGRAVLHVDHDSTIAGGDLTGDHFVMARRIEGDRVIIADPAPGTEDHLDLRTLSGVVMWGRTPKQYQVRSVRPVWKA